MHINGKNYIYEYYQAIKEGKETAGRWIHLVYDIVVHGIEKGVYVFDQGKANDAINWMEKHSFHTEGALAPQNLKFELWQKAMLSCVYGLMNPKDGKRQFREVLWIIGRKNGKTLVAASVCKHNWFIDGGYGAKVYCTAPMVDQADLVYSSVWQMTQLDPEWQQLRDEIQASKDQHNKFTVDDSMLAKTTVKGLLIPGTNSLVRKISYMTRDANGFNPSLVVCDEIASWVGVKGLRHYEVLKSAIGAREMGNNPSLIFSCSTAGYTNDSIYDELFGRATRFLLGDSNETKLLPFLYTIDDIDKWDDINELKKSNPNLGVSIPVDYLLEEINIARGSLSKKSEFITKYCNIKQNSSQAWLSSQDIEKCCSESLRLKDFRSSYCVAGVDLSQTTDLTAAVVVIERDGELYVFAHFWLPAERIDEATSRDGLPYNIYIQRGLMSASGDNYVDYHDVYDWLVKLVEDYEILPLVVGYDRYSAQYLIQDLDGYGFQTDDVYQGDNLWPVLQEMEGLIKDGRIHIDNDLLKAHFFNSAIKMNVERGRGRLIKLNPKDHIDGMAAFADAMTVRQKWYDELGERLRNES